MPNLKWVRIVGIFAALWNAAGIFSYLQHVGVIGDGATLPGAVEMPAAVTACFAVGVFGGVAGSIGLAMLARWARPLLWLSWIGTVIDWAWVFGWSGSASMPLGVTVLLIATMLALIGEWMSRRFAAPMA
jgi:hypothetical protein